MICLKNQNQAIFQNQHRVQCCFGDPNDPKAIVPVNFIQPSVLKCRVPSRSQPGMVQIFLIYDNVPQYTMNAQPFEYKLPPTTPKPAKKRIKEPMSEANFGEREFKVRIIERLSELESKLSSNQDSACPPQNNETPSEEIARFNSSNYDFINQNMLETISREYIQKILEQILQKLSAKYDQKYVIECINQIDKDGYALIHYFTLLEYNQAIQILIQHGADVNIRSTRDNSFPLKIAAQKGYEATVQLLIRQGKASLENNANPKNKLPKNVNLKKNESFNIALKNKNYGVAECILRDISLKDAIKTRDRDHSKSPRLRERLGIDQKEHRRRNSVPVKMRTKQDTQKIKKKYHIEGEEDVIKIQKI